jgi:hypothetical protein
LSGCISLIHSYKLLSFLVIVPPCVWLYGYMVIFSRFAGSG